MALKDADIRPTSGTITANVGEVDRSRHGRPVLRQLSFNLKALDKYSELLNLEMEVMNIL